MPQPSEHEIEVFNVALELPVRERAEYLDKACAGDGALRQRVEELLKASEESSACLDDPSAVSPGPGGTARPPLSPAEKPGDRIGRYKLLQQIGEGGCGVVYMAEQEEPVHRRVALKVIKLGMDTKQVIARFEAERQALALMDHPNIAKVLDAGATETGRPYFVMELVRGIKVTDYCDENHLSTEQRLHLFVQVCQAIQHAHQKGIIHRDIKPSNVLVADHDGVPVPKIIDFGIAKATTDQRLTDKTLFTAFEQFIGTPAYMSPEQAQLSGLDIDTRSDIYSLGVLLYELLTGSTPFDSKALMQAGLDEIRRTIREQEPVRPSTRLSTLAAADLTEVAKQRHAEPAKLGSLIRGDLDWIVMKALEKDRARRYETANGLARDIQRHLNCEPVLARPPSRLYEFKKTVRRHKFGFAAATAVAAALVIGLGLSTWLFVKEKADRQRAEAERKIAETEAAKATAISDFLQQLLSSANPEAVKGSEYTVRQLLDDFSAGLGKQLAGQPEVEATVRATIGNAYYRLGVRDKAEPHLERALALRRRLYGEHSLEVAQSLVDHAWNLLGRKRRSEAEAEARQALDIYQRRGADAQLIIHALNALAVILRNSPEGFEEVEAVLEEALALARNSPQRQFPELANIMHNLADAMLDQAKYVEAEKLAQQAVEMHRRLQGPEHPETAWSLLFLGRALAGQHKLADAERAYREALGIFRRYYSFHYSTVQAVVLDLTGVLEARGDSAGVESLYREVLAGERAALGNDSLPVAEALSGLAVGLHAQGKEVEADKASREAVEIMLKLRGEDLANLPPGARRLAEVLQSQGKSQDAEKLYADVIKSAHQKLGETNLILGELLHDYGEFLSQENKFEAAVEYRLKSLPIRRAQPDDNLAWTLRNLGSELALIGRPQEAEAYLRESLALYRKLHQQEDIHGTAWATERLGYALYQQHKLPEGEQAYRDALTIYLKLGAGSTEDYAAALRSLLGVLREENKLADGEALCREILAQQRAAFTNGSPSAAQTLSSLVDSLVAQGKQAEADIAAREAAQNSPNDAELKLRVAELFRTEGKWAEAEQYYRGGVEVLHATRSAAAVASILHAHALTAHGQSFLPQAEEVYREALASYRAAYGETNADLARCLYDLSRALSAQTKYAEAEATARESLAMRRKLFGDEHPDVNLSLAALVQVLQGQGKLADADATAREATQKWHTAMAQFEKLASDSNRHQECWSFAISYEGIGGLLQEIGQTQAAEKAYRDTQVLWRKLVAGFNTEDHRFHLALNYDALGNILRETGRATESLKVYRDAQEIWVKLVADFNLEDRRMHLGYTDDDIGHLLKQAGRFDEATEAYRQALGVWKKLVAEFNKDAYRNRLTGTLVSLATTLQTAGEWTEAKLLFSEAAEHADAQTLNGMAWLLATGPDPKLRDGTNAVVFAEKAVAATNRKNVSYLDALAAAYAETGQFAKAISIQQEAITLSQNEQEKKDLGSRLKLYENNSPYRDHGSLAELTRDRLREGKFAEAEGLARECLALREREIPDDWRTFNAKSMLGGSLLGQKKYAEAEPLLLSAYEAMKQREAKIPHEGKPRLRETLQRLAQLYETTNRPDQATEWKRKLAEFDKTEK